MTKDPYKTCAGIYDRLFEPSITVVRQIGLKMHPPNEGMLVLDVGCGTGSTLKLYHQAGCNVFGIDLSPGMVEASKRKLGDQAEIRLGDASRMPYADDNFDLVTTYLTMHEMTVQMRSAILSEMARVVKPDGRILLVDFNPGPLCFPKGWMYRTIILIVEFFAGWEHFNNHLDFISRDGLRGLISAQDLRVVREKTISGGNMALMLVKTGR